MNVHGIQPTRILWIPKVLWQCQCGNNSHNSVSGLQVVEGTVNRWWLLGLAALVILRSYSLLLKIDTSISFIVCWSQNPPLFKSWHTMTNSFQHLLHQIFWHVLPQFQWNTTLSSFYAMSITTIHQVIGIWSFLGTYGHFRWQKRHKKQKNHLYLAEKRGAYMYTHSFGALNHIS
jgi:hypothetical protein